MTTTKHRIAIKITCVLIMLLGSASTVEAYPPDNAAVLYYKAFLILKEPSEEVKEMMADLRKGRIEPNDQIRKSLDENKFFMDFVETAAGIRDCDWGHDISKGFDLLLPELSKLRFAAFMVTAKAQVLAEQGEYREALNECVTMHKMARHVGDNFLISYLGATALNNLANERIQDILSQMPGDDETLRWLRDQVFDAASTGATLRGAMNSEREIAIQQMRKEKIGSILDSMGDAFKDANLPAGSIEKIRSGDEEILRANREYYTDLVTRAQVAIDLPYPQSRQRLAELTDKGQKDIADSPAPILADVLSPAPVKLSSVETKRVTFFNAIKAAIEIYIVKAKTGRLPDELPAGLPRDLFSGRDFEYDKTKDGFVLRCRGKDLDKDEIYQYEFKVSD